MRKYIFNPDTAKVHDVANKKPQCNFPKMDDDELVFYANNNLEAISMARNKFSPSASGCEHCMA